MTMVSLKEKYISEVSPKLNESFKISNNLRTPKLVKIVVNMGLGVTEKDALKTHTEELAAITGQKPLVTKAKKSISNFKLREGMSIGAKVTLRGAMMYEFLDRLINAALPRIRDFRGVSSSAFDGRGNYTLGIKELDIFPEIDPDKMGLNQGMNITIVTTSKTDDEACELLKLLGMPFAEKK
jgi:large subunit ribosomal protein L5